MSSIFNISVGLLGHVDCGKTSLAKVLSTISSTASFDKSPQSQERGITIDLGFSCFTVSPLPTHICENYDQLQVTLVDCPGHASLIRTIIGGSQIINIVLLVIDIRKGFETQTAECLVLAELACDSLIVVLNKIDLLEQSSQNVFIEKTIRKVKKTLAQTKFQNAPILSVSANPSAPAGIERLKEEILQNVKPPDPEQNVKPMIMAVDHCFCIRGQGTIFTGNILQGQILVNDMVDLPQLQMKKKVKSIQIFRRNVKCAVRGDRVALCVTQLDPKLFERGLLCSENVLKFVYACVIDLHVIKYYKEWIKSKSKYHCSVGYDTVLATLTIFKCEKVEKDSNSVPRYTNEESYLFVEQISKQDAPCFALLEFDKPILCVADQLVIGSRLDMQVHTGACRLAFHGKVQYLVTDKTHLLKNHINIYKKKVKQGCVDRILNSTQIVCKNLFSKNQVNSIEEMFVNFKVRFSTGQVGTIESAFGKNGKVRIGVEEGTQNIQENVVVELPFRKYLFVKNKIMQPSM